jgi:hypothetical protein
MKGNDLRFVALKDPQSERDKGGRAVIPPTHRIVPGIAGWKVDRNDYARVKK